MKASRPAAAHESGRMAYNLYYNGTLSVLDIEDTEKKTGRECSSYTKWKNFCCGHTRYFLEQLKSVIGILLLGGLGGYVC